LHCFQQTVVAEFFMLFLLGLLGAIAPLAIDLYLPSFASIAADFNVPVGLVQQTLAVFMFGFAFSQLLYGPLSDRFGRKPLIIGGLVLYAIASVGCSFAGDVGSLMGWRFLQSLGCGAVVVVVPAMVRDMFRDVEAAKALSIVMLTMTVAPLVAPSLGGQLLKYGGWRWVFDVQAVVASVLLIAAAMRLPETHLSQRRPFNLRTVVSGYVDVMKDNQALVYIFGGAFAYAGLFVFIAASPFVYMVYFKVSVEMYGIMFGSNVAAIMLFNWLNSRVIVRFGVEKMLHIASVSLLLAGICMVIVTVAGMGLWWLFASIVWFVGTLGLIGVNSASAAINCFPQMAGTVSAFMSGLRFFLAALGAAVVGWFDPQSPLPMAAMMLACAVVAFGMLYVWQKRLSNSAA
jgi:DHA1 family bicyclomycin/chloramphenicol resistance-like MFS transporter